MRIIFGLIMLAVTLTVNAANPSQAAQLHQKAVDCLSENKNDEALKLCLEAEKAYIAECNTNSDAYAQILQDTGKAFLLNSDYSTGRQYYHKSLALREKLHGKSNDDYIIALNDYNISFYLTKEFDEAIKNQKEVVELCKTLPAPHPKEGTFILNLGKLYINVKDYDNAVKYLEEALPKVEKFGEDYEFILDFLGNYYFDKNDSENVTRLLQLIDEHNKAQFPEDCNDLDCYLNKAKAFYVMGNMAEAKEVFLEIMKMDLNSSELAEVYKEYAGFMHSDRNYEEAGDYYLLAATELEKAEGINADVMELIENACLEYYGAKDYRKAIDTYYKISEILEKHNYSDDLTSKLLPGSIEGYRKNRVSDKMKNYDSSDEKSVINKALDLMNSLNESSLTRKIEQTGMGNIAGRDSKEVIENALASQLMILESAEENLGLLFKAEVTGEIASMYATLEDFVNAVEYYSRYLSLIRDALSREFLWRTPNERAATWKKQNELIKAMNRLITNLPEESDLYSRLSSLMYEGQLLSKGILLSSSMEFDKVLNTYGTQEMQSIYSVIKSNQRKIAEMQENGGSLDEIARLNRETDEMLLSLQKENAKVADYMNYLLITSQDVLKNLGDDGAAIEFLIIDIAEGMPQFEGNNLVTAVVLSNDFPQGVIVPIGFVNDFRALSEDKSIFQNDALGAAVWGNILQLIPGKNKIYFAADGILNNFAVEYMSLNGKPIMQQYDIYRLSSTRELARKHTQAPIRYASIFGNIDYDEVSDKVSNKKKIKRTNNSNKRSGETGEELAFNPLTHSKAEIDGVKTILDKHTKKTYLYEGIKASKKEFLSQEELPLNLLHIVTHGAYLKDASRNEADGMQSSILTFAGVNLSDIDLTKNAGVVNAAEVAEMSLPDCEMVVLAACESGLGKLGDDGVFGLQRGFKNAGVQTLLVSLNEVADEVTTEMMISFYKYFLENNMSKREALKKAQLEMKSKYVDDPHNTWASFILIDALD